MRNKKVYSKPILESETFVPQEYVAKCKYDVSYKGKCDTSGYIFTDTDKDGEYNEGRDPYKYDNTACEHYFETTEKPEYNAFAFESIEFKSTGLFKGYWVGKGRMTRVYNFDNTHANHFLDDTVHHNVS